MSRAFKSGVRPNLSLENRRLSCFLCKMIILFLSGFASQLSYAQGANAFGPSSTVSKNSEAKESADEGLKSATPNDDFAEFDQSNDTLTGNGQFTNLPEATNQASSAPKDGPANFGNGGDDLFGDGNVGQDASTSGTATGMKSGTSADTALDAFGTEGVSNPTGDAAVNSKMNNVPNKAAPSATIDATVSPTNPASSALGSNPSTINGSKPANNPSNAQVLLNEIKKEDSPPANLTEGDPAANSSSQGIAPSTSNQGTTAGESAVSNSGSADVPSSAKGLPPPNEFAGAPPVPGTMRIMAEGEAPQEYRVQPGDTLYDICDQLIDEPGYWPKLWSLNPEIKNPHFIFPGMKLGFYPGDDETPPYLQVIQEEDIIPIDKGSLNEIALVKENINLSEEVMAPAEEQIEVIGPDQVEVGSEIEEAVLSGGRVYSGDEIRLQVPGFILAEDKSISGYVLGGRDGGLTASQGQDIVVEPSEKLATGQIYTVLRRHDIIKSPASGDVVGTLYYFVANVRINRTVGSDLFIGRIQDSLLGVQAEDVLVDYISSFRVIPSRHSGASYSALDASVVAFDVPDGEIGGAGHFAFLDKGRGAGVSPGMYVRVYQRPGYLSASSGDAELPEDWQGVAIMRIIDVTDAGAVGYLVESSQEVRIGDLTKKP